MGTGVFFFFFFTKNVLTVWEAFTCALCPCEDNRSDPSLSWGPLGDRDRVEYTDIMWHQEESMEPCRDEQRLKDGQT